ncbi:unnamed protein product [Adineta steineri]|uniref:F-box domain-containing protein n=1 Tax=Adineta steineri TaxID=433720 RepID=A0A813VTN4_9BILA|nr:unnamed protein product [Adineta steineri]CAF1548075.1 unnamed protein product [Adineta steineri]
MIVSVFEDLPNELIVKVFVYLSPYDLLRAFENVNWRLLCILSKQKLCLPNNQGMSRQVYHQYLSSILPTRQSQIVSLYLSDQCAAGAVQWFFDTCIYLLPNFPLRALTIEGVSRQIFDILLSKLHFSPHLQHMTIDIHMMQWYREEYLNLPDFYYLFPVLKNIPQLESLRFNRDPTRPSVVMYENLKLFPPVAYHLHTLSIDSCSHELIVALLHSSLPVLRQLKVRFELDPLDYSPTCVSISSNRIPQLSHVSFTNAKSFRWVLVLFADVYQHGQLRSIVLYDRENIFRHKQLVTANELHRWFLKSIQCTSFQFHFRHFIYDGLLDIIKRTLIEYQNLFDVRYQLNRFNSFDLFVQYPKKIKFSEIDNINNDLNVISFDSSSSSLYEDLCDRWHDEIRLDLNGFSSQLDISQFALNNALEIFSILVNQTTSVRIRKLYINMNIPTWLSSLYIAAHGNSTKILDDTGIETVDLSGINTCLIKAAEQIVSVFGGVKNLILFIDNTLDLTLGHLQIALRRFVEGLPTLIYFSCAVHARSTRAVDMSEISPWILSGGLNRSVSFRCKRYNLDLWL